MCHVFHMLVLLEARHFPCNRSFEHVYANQGTLDNSNDDFQIFMQYFKLWKFLSRENCHQREINIQGFVGANQVLKEVRHVMCSLFQSLVGSLMYTVVIAAPKIAHGGSFEHVYAIQGTFDNNNECIEIIMWHFNVCNMLPRETQTSQGDRYTRLC